MKDKVEVTRQEKAPLDKYFCKQDILSDYSRFADHARSVLAVGGGGGGGRGFLPE